ncbi:MarR family transcriptional regulator [Streptomyces sp. NPDC005017]|uniref:MarR family transcriptional regulator n=1 Tax=Streptomyces sp. NPDC005017 TaxID=3364706 RepID=UPI003696D5E6
MDRMIATAQFGQQDIARSLGLNVTDATCLGFLIEASLAGRSLVAGDLAERARLTTGAVTGVINRLERAGYVRREPDPQDRRRVHVAMDDSAQQRLIEVYAPLYGRLTALFADYEAEELAVLTDWFTRARSLFLEALEEMRQGVGSPRTTAQAAGDGDADDGARRR